MSDTRPGPTTATPTGKGAGPVPCRHVHDAFGQFSGPPLRPDAIGCTGCGQHWSTTGRVPVEVIVRLWVPEPMRPFYPTARTVVGACGFGLLARMSLNQQWQERARWPRLPMELSTAAVLFAAWEMSTCRRPQPNPDLLHDPAREWKPADAADLLASWLDTPHDLIAQSVRLAKQEGIVQGSGATEPRGKGSTGEWHAPLFRIEPTERGWVMVEDLGLRLGMLNLPGGPAAD